MLTVALARAYRDLMLTVALARAYSGAMQVLGPVRRPVTMCPHCFPCPINPPFSPPFFAVLQVWA